MYTCAKCKYVYDKMAKKCIPTTEWIFLKFYSFLE